MRGKTERELMEHFEGQFTVTEIKQQRHNLLTNYKRKKQFNLVSIVQYEKMLHIFRENQDQNDSSLIYFDCVLLYVSRQTLLLLSPHNVRKNFNDIMISSFTL